MIRKTVILLMAAALVAGAGSLAAQSLNSGLRGPAPLNEEGPAPPMTRRVTPRMTGSGSWCRTASRKNRPMNRHG